MECHSQGGPLTVDFSQRLEIIPTFSGLARKWEKEPNVSSERKLEDKLRGRAGNERR